MFSMITIISKYFHIQTRPTSLYTSGLVDPISSKLSRSQNFTVPSAEPAKIFACYNSMLITTQTISEKKLISGGKQ